MANVGISYRDKDNAYYHKHVLTAENSVNVTPPNILTANQNVPIQIFPDNNGVDEIIIRQFQNQSGNKVYVSIGAFEPNGIANGQPNTIPGTGGYHYTLADQQVFDCSKFDNDVYAVCTAGALTVSTCLMTRSN